jgi:hypothetical protein
MSYSRTVKGEESELGDIDVLMAADLSKKQAVSGGRMKGKRRTNRAARMLLQPRLETLLMAAMVAVCEENLVVVVVVLVVVAQEGEGSYKSAKRKGKREEKDALSSRYYT